jgi:hypothetical protein
MTREATVTKSHGQRGETHARLRVLELPAFPAPSSKKGKDFKAKPRCPRRGDAAPALRKGLFPCWQEADRAVVSPAKFPFGNQVLTLISVWLEA